MPNLTAVHSQWELRCFQAQHSYSIQELKPKADDVKYGKFSSIFNQSKNTSSYERLCFDQNSRQLFNITHLNCCCEKLRSEKGRRREARGTRCCWFNRRYEMFWVKLFHGILNAEQMLQPHMTQVHATHTVSPV